MEKEEKITLLETVSKKKERQSCFLLKEKRIFFRTVSKKKKDNFWDLVSKKKKRYTW